MPADLVDLEHADRVQPVHILGRLGIDVEEIDGRRCAILDPDPILIDPHGHVSLGALGMLFDMAGSMTTRQAIPDPFVHADLTVHRLAPASGPMIAYGTVLRRGRRSVVVQVDLRDGRGGRVAASTQQMVVYPPSSHLGEASVRSRPPTRLAADVVFDGRCRLRQSLHDELGITHVDDVWSMGISPDRINTRGGVHGGVAIALVDSSATGAAAARWARPARIVTAAVRYLCPALVGPFTARPEVLSDDRSVALVRVPIIDGAGNLAITADVGVVPA